MDFIEFIDNLVKSQMIYHSSLEGNEAQTRWLLIDPLLLDGLGYSRGDILLEYSIDTDDRVSKHNKSDYSILINRVPRLLIESKSLGVDLYSHYSQLQDYFDRTLSRYNYNIKGLIGILTDGDLYLFYTNSVDCNRMDRTPYFTIRLSVSEDFERVSLLRYSKYNMLNYDKQYNIANYHTYEEEYELGVAYRIDTIDSVYNYFMSQGKEIRIDKIYLRGKVTRYKSLRSLYKYLVNQIHMSKPGLLYSLAMEEDRLANKTISSLKYSLSPIGSSDFYVLTGQGKVYISLPSNQSNMIDRIVNIVKQSNYGIANVLVSFNEK